MGTFAEFRWLTLEGLSGRKEGEVRIVGSQLILW